MWSSGRCDAEECGLVSSGRCSPAGPVIDVALEIPENVIWCSQVGLVQEVLWQM